jgi:hypothetical protein
MEIFIIWGGNKMKEKIIGIFIVLLMILLIIPTVSADEQTSLIDDGVYLKGLFKLIEEDEEFLYMKPLNMVLLERINGTFHVYTYSRFIPKFCKTIKFSKPLEYFGFGNNIRWMIGKCDTWSWVE